MHNKNIFARQVDQLIKEEFNKSNHLTVLNYTPLVLQKIGVNNYSITVRYIENIKVKTIIIINVLKKSYL